MLGLKRMVVPWLEDGGLVRIVEKVVEVGARVGVEGAGREGGEALIIICM